jgi:serine/threonine protein kinase/6-phosphogluconolactonase (cycloisomerase 2 family)
MSTLPETAKQIFLEAVERIAPSDWPAFLDGACRTNPELRVQVEDLLKAHQQPDSLFDVPPTEDARRISVPLGECIGKYKLLQKIGEGGFGVVYMAEQTRPVRRNVALKIIKPGMDSKEVIARFEAERQALAMMDHPNIAKVLDGGETESGHPYFVMELVKGIPLTKFCDENKLDTRSRLSLFKDVCNAIQHAHQKGVIHRDIKPSNVMVTLHDGKPVPKVIDFGVSKAISQQLTTKTLFTQYGQMVGTPQYMSPEQAEMSGLDIDTRSDIYSLGVLLYELLTGTTPLDPERLRQTAYAELQKMIREDEPPRPSRRLSTLGEQTAKIAANRSTSLKVLSSTLQGELDWIVMKALDKDRNRRYDTAKGFALDIEHYLANEPVSACPPSTAYMVRKAIRRHRQSFAVASGLLLTLLLGLVVALWQWNKADMQEKLADKQRAIAIAAEKTASQERDIALQSQHDLEIRTQKQTLSMAFDAINSGNTSLCLDLLSRCADLKEGAATNPAWRFLNERCREQLGSVTSLDNPMVCAAFDPMGDYLFIGLKTGDIGVYDAGSNKRLPWKVNTDSLDDSTVFWDLVVSEDGQWLAAATGIGDDGGQVLIWELDRSDGALTGVPAATLKHEFPVRCVDFQRGGKRLCSIDSNGHLKLWGLLSFQELQHQQTPFRTRCVARFSPGNKDHIFAYGWEERSVKAYSSETLEELSNFDYDGRLQHSTFAPDGSSIAITGYAGTQIWDISNGLQNLTKKLSWRRGTHCEFSENGELLAVCDTDHKSIWVFECDSGRILERFHCGELDGPPMNIQFQQHGLIWISGSSVRRFEFSMRPIETAKNWYAPFALSNFSPVVAFPTPSNDVGLWNVVSGDIQVMTNGNQEAAVKSIALSTSGKQVAVSRMKTENNLQIAIEIWNTVNGKPTSFSIDSNELWVLAFSPIDEGLLLSTCGRGGVQLSNLRSGSTATIQDATPEGKSIIAAQFSPDGKYVVVGGGTWGQGNVSTAQCWQVDAAGSTKISHIINTQNNYSSIFSSDGKTIGFIDLRKDKLELYDLITRQMLYSKSLSASRIMSCDFAPNDQSLVVTSPSGALVFVDSSNLEPIGTYRVDRQLRHVKFLDGYDRIIASTMDGTILNWKY